MSWLASANAITRALETPPCFHHESHTVPVHLSTGELVSVLCGYCDESLPPGFMGRYDHEEKYYVEQLATRSFSRS